VVYVGAPQTVAPESANAAPSVANGQAAFDMGVTSNGGAVVESNGLNGRSLGEVARDLRQRMQNANARVYTNSDVNAMPNAGGITGSASNVSPQQFPANGTYPVGENGVIRQNGQAVGSPENPTGNAMPTQPATEQPQPMNQPAPAINPQQKPSAGTPPPPQMSQAHAPANPADQNAPARESQENSKKTLPKSASLLPLIALVGAGATVAGLARK
ncbi:MAG: hypothetical protein ACRD3E_10675, partial [Terriglobales bacterium]